MKTLKVPFVQYLGALFAEHPLDLIVCIGAPAAAFTQRHRHDLFANTPMVFTAVEERRVPRSVLSDNVSVVAARINHFAALENVLRVLPDTKNVMVVAGTSPTEKFWKDEIAKAAEPLTNQLTLSWTDHLSFEELLKQAAALPSRSAIFWELMIVDAAGVVHDGNTALARLHKAANAPIFSHNESFFGRRDCRGPNSPGGRYQPTDSRCCCSHPRWREGGRHQNPTHRIRNAEVRLARNAALGNQRKEPPTGKRDLLS